MDILKVIGVGLVTVVAIMIVKPIKPDIAVIIGLVGGILVISMVINYVVDIIVVFTNIAEKTGIQMPLMKTVLKIIGVGYLTEFSAGLCSDAGSSSMGDKITFAGKILILVMALPIVTSIIDILVSLLP